MKEKARRVGALIAVLATGLATVSLMTVPAGAVTANASELDFGRVVSGLESSPQSVEIRVGENERVVRVSGTEPAFPRVSETCTGVIGPATCYHTHKFAPRNVPTRADSPAVQDVSVIVCDSRLPERECMGNLTEARTRLHGVAVQHPGFRPTVIAIDGPDRIEEGTTGQFVIQLKDDNNNPINGQPLKAGDKARLFRPEGGAICDGTTGTLPATSSRPQIEGAILCNVTPQVAGSSYVYAFFLFGNPDLGESSKERPFTVVPRQGGGTGQAQQGLTIEENDKPPALAPPPSSLTNNSAPPPATNTSTQAPPMTPLQMAQQTVASFSPSQLAAMTPQQLSGVAASLVSPQQMASMSITDRLQVAGLIQQLIAGNVRAKLAAAGIGLR